MIITSRPSLELKSQQPQEQKGNKFMSELKKQRELQSMVIPGIIFLIIFSYVPIYGLIMAFQRYTVMDTVRSAQWVGLEKFHIISSDPFFLGFRV